MKQCKFEGCENLGSARELCKGHYNQWYGGRPLTPLDPNRKRKAAEGPCSFEGCDRPMKTKGYCNTHYTQYRKGRKLTPIGSTSTRPQKAKGFSETKTCDTCDETKNWRLFIMGTEQDYDECRECYRKRLLEPPKEGKPKALSHEELMTIIDHMASVQQERKIDVE